MFRFNNESEFISAFLDVSVASRTSSFALLCIDNSVLKKIDVNYLTNNFALPESRKMSFGGV